MDKEEAMKILKDFHDKSALFSVRTALETLHPELKESEDDKVRKTLVELVKCNERCGYFMINNITTSAMLAWLEKQATPKMVEDAFLKGCNDTKKCLLKKQGEQKPWSKEDEKEYKYVLKFVDNILNNCGNKKDYEHSKRCYDWLKSLRPQPKQEWNEEDQNALEDVREAVVHYWGGETQDILLYWLKSLKQRIGGEQ